MTEISRSPKRGTFGIDKLVEKFELGETTQEHVDQMTEFYQTMIDQKYVQETKPEWRENNLEFDLRTTVWILEKVREDEIYSQNLYAAMCNNQFAKTQIENTAENVAKILRDGTPLWSCSWRYAGGIIADMRQEGDYIDWYCSGIRNDYDSSENTGYWQRKYVSESIVTEEIEQDLRRLGWRVIPYED
jgi:hypothetical protein